MLKVLKFSLALTFLGALTLGPAAQAADQPQTRDYTVSDSTSEMVPKYKEAIDAKNYDGALALLDAQLGKVPADSYDAAFLNMQKMQTLMGKGDYMKAIEPMEKVVALSNAHTPTFFEDKVIRELYYYLTQLYFQEAVNTKDVAVIKVAFDKADKAFQQWKKITPKSNPDAQLLYGQLLYNKATIDVDHPDLETIKRALDEIDLGLHLAIKPKDSFYIIKFVCLQQLNRIPEATEVLEQVVKLKPDSATYWQQLAALYLSNKQDLRAIITFERAQENGFMSTQKDNYNLVGLYFNIGQYEKAADLLQSGLQNGKIENDFQNWQLLMQTYEQMQEPYKAIDALNLAKKAFPKSGQLEFLQARIYQGLEKPDLALPHLQAAVTKGNLEKPGQTYMFLAYVATDLKKFDIALDAAKKAATYPDGGKDAKKMVTTIEELIREREAKKNKT